MEKISVIVPVYNTERYLEECVQSILNQTYSEIEVILVDDGSTDGSGEICDRFAAKDQRVKVIHQKNSGLSGARNSGLDVCSGLYITFVDADDALDRCFLEVLYRNITDNNCDIAICSYQLYYGDNKTETSESSVQLYNRMDCFRMLNGWRDPVVTSFIVAWAKLYRGSLWKEIRFPLGTWHEDEFVAHVIFNQVSNIVWTDMPLYLYRQHELSFSGSGMKNPSHDALFLALSERCIFYEEHAPELVNGAVHHLLRECNSFYDVYAQDRDEIAIKKRRWLVKVYRDVYCRTFGKLSANERVKGSLFIVCPRVYHCMSLLKGSQQI